MSNITFIEPDGTHRQVAAREGQSVMQVAVEHAIRGIEADCAGSCSCATCHAYIDPSWFDRLEAPQLMETDMLAFALDTTPQSRLTCQLRVTPEMDGLIVHLPQSQA